MASKRTRQLQIICDSEVPLGSDPQDHAKLTLPSQLRVAMSKIPNAGEGVWAIKALASNVRFGPFQGDVRPLKGKSSSYCWLLKNRGKPTAVVDAQRCETSNWMRYVNCARSFEEQNLQAYQRNGQLFYKTLCSIPANTELLVWYGNEYASELGIDLNGPPLDSKKLVGRFSCQPCGLGFISPLLLNQHARTNSCAAEHNRRRKTRAPLGKSANPFSCELCGAKFRDEWNKSAHKALHSRRRLYPCSLCDKSFKFKSNQDVHMLTHTKRQPHKCSHCKKQFSQSGSLAIHMRTHTGERPYSCVTCGSTFTTSSNLRQHHGIHTSAKPYRCNLCNAAFAYKPNLYKHKKKHSSKI